MSNPDLIQIHDRQVAQSRRSLWFVLALLTAITVVVIAVVGASY